MSPCSPRERRLGAWGWALVTDVSSQMYIFKPRRLTAIHAVVHQIWQILCNEETLSRSLILSRMFSGYCGSLCSNLDQIWKIVHQRAPRTVWPRGRLHIDMHVSLFVYCGSEEYYGFVSCCSTKSRPSPKLKTFFHWYVFYLLAFRQLMALET